MSDGITPIDNFEDFIDSRDVIARIAYLTECRDDDSTEGGLALDEDEVAELAALTALAEQSAGYASDWEYGETLIRDSYFEDYAREMASDIGAIDPNASWPQSCIDWEQAARELQMDYTSVDFDGVTYWVR